MVDVRPHELFNLLSVRVLEGRKATNIERLKEVRRMRRHTKRDNLLFLAKCVEFSRYMAVVAVENQKAPGSTRTILCMLFEVLNPLKAEFIRRPAIFAHSDNPIAWYAGVGRVEVPSVEVAFTFEDDERRNRPTFRINSLDHCNPLAIAWLN